MLDTKEIINEVKHLNTIFRDPKVMEIGYIPKSTEQILHRDGIIKMYIYYLKKVFSNDVPENIFVFGKTGTGKTMLSKLVTKNIEEAASEEGINVSVVYINCKKNRANTILMKHLIKKMEGLLNVTHENLFNASSNYYFRFCDLVNIHTGVIIVILDEIHKLQNPDILYDFSRMKEDEDTDKNICIIGISNDLHFLDELPPEIKSTLAKNEIEIPPYDALQLQDILKSRAKLAFYEDSLDEIVIPLCSAFAAQEHGDARRALDLLRMAGNIAEKNHQVKILEEHVRIAEEEIETTQILKNTQTLPLHSKVVLLACIHMYVYPEKRRTTTSTLYTLYEKYCQIVDLKVLSRRRVLTLIDELTMLGFTSTTTISGDKGGRVKVHTLRVPVNSTMNVLFEDYLVKPLQKIVTERKAF